MGYSHSCDGSGEVHECKSNGCLSYLPTYQINIHKKTKGEPGRQRK